MAFLAAALPAAIGAVGSIIGGNKAASAQRAAAQQALTGYNYLNGNSLINSTQASAINAQNNQENSLGNQTHTAADIASLLTGGQDSPAFNNYLNSTGYNFQLKQGTDALTGNAAAKGLLNSGATAKALTNYGQNLASTTFNNYLGQMGGLATLQGQNAAGYGGVVGQGLTATGQVGAAGNTGGGNAATQTAAAGQSQANGIGGAFGAAQNVFANNSGSIGNFFGQAASSPGAMGLY